MTDPSSSASTSPALDLDSLMVRYQQADPAAVTLLIQAVSPLLSRYFNAQVARHDDVYDLVQETWLRVHKARHTYRPGVSLLPWLYAIARHTLLDHYRRSSRRQKRELAMDQVPEPAVPVAPGHQGMADMENLLAALPDSQRDVLMMLKVTGMSIEEVARATASTVGSVKQKAHRAYRTLRALLDGKSG